MKNDTYEDQKSKIESNVKTITILSIVFGIAGLLLLIWGVYLKYKNEIQTYGEFGDFVSGTAVASFTLASILLIYLAFLGQKKQLLIQEII